MGPPGVKCAYLTYSVPFLLIFCQALARDGFRCMLTGMFDLTSTKKNEELAQLCDTMGAFSVVVQTSHILNESTMQDIDPQGGGEKVTVLNKARATDTSRVLCCPPSPTSFSRRNMLPTL